MKAAPFAIVATALTIGSLMAPGLTTIWSWLLILILLGVAIRLRA